MNRQKSTFRISFYVRRTRPNKHGEVPVCVRITVNGQRAARRHAGDLGRVQQMAAHHLHFDFQQAGRGIRALGLQRVRADQLRKARAFMGRGIFCRLLLVQLDLHAAIRQPECRLAPGQTGTNDFQLHTCPLSGSPLRGGFKAVTFSQSPSQTRSPL